MDNTDTLNILQHNVQHWKSNKTTLSNLYKDINPDVILLNSHGMKSQENIKIYNYTTYLINSNDELHDGSAILVKHNLKHKIKDDYDTDILQITIETSTGPINIATTYLPPRRPYLPITDFHAIASQSDPTYIIGDMNAHHPNLDKKTGNNVGKAIMMLINNNKIRHLGPDFPTFLAHNSTSTPDLILSNNKTYHNFIAQPGPTTPSDHIPILIKITSQPIRTPSPPIQVFSKTNWDDFRTEIQNKANNINTDPYMTQQTLESSLKEWITAITSTMENHIPTKSFRTLQKPIYNQRIKELQWWSKQLLQNSLIFGWSYTKYITYKTIKQAIKTECKEQNNKNWESKIKELNKLYKDPPKFWQNIKKLKGNPTVQKPYIIQDNEKIYDVKDKEQIFRDIWSKVFRISPIENINFDQQNDHIVNTYVENNKIQILPYQHANPNNINNDNYFTSKITIQEIKQIIKQLKNNTPGHTKINKIILQNLHDDTIETYTKLLNISLSMGYFPNIFKHAKIKLIPKANKPSTDPSNYRPISLLEVPGKIFEKIINNRLRNYLETNDILPSGQHGFRRLRSTDTALATITEITSKALSEKKQCCLVLRDVSKAFDKVWTNGLKYKILQLQIPTILAKLLCSFLDERTASISLNSYDGPPFRLYSGVPQGSSISPTLYTVYTHDMPPPATDGINILYADDITQIVIQPGKSRNMLAKKVEKEIKNINTFENKWKIKTNTSKFTILPLAIKKTSPITIDGEIIPYANTAKILGLKLNRQGYSNQIKDTARKTTAALHTIKRFEKLDTNIKLHLVKACVLPILTYPVYTLNALSCSQTLSLQKIQNKALRFAFGEKYPYTKTTEELHQQANIEAINITLYNRGNTIKHKLENILQDNTYINAIQNHQEGNEHTWFRRPINRLCQHIPMPLYTKLRP